MKVIYTGSQTGLAPLQQKKIEAKFTKLSRILDSRKGEREARVFLSTERHLTQAEVTVNFYDHLLVGAAKDSDLFAALSEAIDRLEKQLLKARTKWRDVKRGSSPKRASGAESEPEAAGETEAGEPRRVFRVDHRTGRKPMTLDEALIAIEAGRDYVVFRDAETDRPSVLLRRRDGNFDLIEA
jgi:putative sigma-54 modulation protein